MRKRIISKAVITPILAIVTGFFFSFLVASSLYESEKKAAAYELQKDIDGLTLTFSRELNVTIDLLYLMQNQILASTELDEKMFNYIAQKFKERLTYVRTIRWLDAVKKTEKTNFENKMSEKYMDYSIEIQKDLQTSFLLTDNTHYFPISYTTKKNINAKILGLDLHSLPYLYRDFEMSWQQGLPVAIFNKKLQKRLMEDESFFVLFPIFSASANSQAERISQIRGFFLVMLDLDSIFEILLSYPIREPIKLTLQQVKQEEVEVLYENVESVSGDLLKKMRYKAKPFFFGGKEWQIVGVPSKDYLAARVTNFPYVIFILGSSIFILLAFIVNRLQSRALNIRYQVNEKTRELKEVNHKLEKLSRSDSLTGLFNRSYFDDVLDAEMKRAQRDELPISLMIVEIDNLEDYSSNNGRNACNNLIRMIGVSLLDGLKRPSDVVARYDNQAFSIILPNTTNGSSIAEHYVDSIKNLKIPAIIGKEGSYMSVSIGGVTVNEAAQIDGAKLRSFAQIALSKAIAQGRNRSQWIFSPEIAQKPY